MVACAVRGRYLPAPWRCRTLELENSLHLLLPQETSQRGSSLHKKENPEQKQGLGGHKSQGGTVRSRLYFEWVGHI